MVFADEVDGSINSASGSELRVAESGSNRKESSQSEVTLQIQDTLSSVGESSISSSDTSFSEVFGDPTPLNRKAYLKRRYKNMLIRAVRRQILLNKYRKELLRGFKVSGVMLLAMDKDGE